MNRYLRLLYSAVITWLVVAVLGGAAGSLVHLEPLPAVHWELIPSIPEIIVTESSRAGISAHLPLAVAWRESRMTHMVGPTNDWGAMQVNLPTAMAMGIDPTSLADPRLAIMIGVNWLAHFREICHSDRNAVWAYAHGRCPKER